MDANRITQKIKHAEEKIQQFLDILASDINSSDIEKHLHNLNLLERIEEMSTLNYAAIQLVPLLLQIIINKKIRAHQSLLKAIISLFGCLKPDGIISEYAFLDITAGTSFTIGEIFEELTNKEYIKNYYLTPRFTPMAENFHLDIDRKYQSLEQDIIKVLTEIPKETSVTLSLITLLKDKTLSSLYPEIMHALSEIGHPAAFPVILELLQEHHDAASSALVAMGLRDIKELKQLLDHGVTEDMWGNDLKEKVFASVKLVIPLFFEALTSDTYSFQDKSLIGFFFKEVGVPGKGYFQQFTQMLPVLYQEDIHQCFISAILISGGIHTVTNAITIFEQELGKQGSFDIPVLKRLLRILEEIGPESKSAIPVLIQLARETDYLTDAIGESLKKISPSIEQQESEKKENEKGEIEKENESADGMVQKSSGTTEPEDETGQLIDKIQKKARDTDPEDYVLY